MIGRAVATVSLATLALGACATGPVHRQPAAVHACAQHAGGGTIDDEAVEARLSQALAELAAAGRTATIGQLAAELEPRPDRQRSRLELASPDERRLDGAQLYDRIRPSVVIVGRRYRCEECEEQHVSTAAGFVLSKAGAVVTSRHVVEGEPGDPLAVMTADGTVLAVRAVLAADRPSDVVVLQTDSSDLVPLPLRPDVAVGSPIFVLSHPDGHFYHLSDGIVARQFALRSDDGQEPVAHLEVTADFAQGSSGAPVVDATGAVVGMVQSTESVYWGEQDGVQEDLQMVFKVCTSAAAIRALIDARD